MAPRAKRPTEPEPIACDVCLTEIPASVAETAEGPDYIYHFCGLECYVKWQEAKEEKPKKLG